MTELVILVVVPVLVVALSGAFRLSSLRERMGQRGGLVSRVSLAGGVCSACGYPLEGLGTTRCPECGVDDLDRERRRQRGARVYFHCLRGICTRAGLVAGVGAALAVLGWAWLGNENITEAGVWAFLPATLAAVCVGLAEARALRKRAPASALWDRRGWGVAPVVFDAVVAQVVGAALASFVAAALWLRLWAGLGVDARWDTDPVGEGVIAACAVATLFAGVAGFIVLRADGPRWRGAERRALWFVALLIGAALLHAALYSSMNELALARSYVADGYAPEVARIAARKRANVDRVVVTGPFTFWCLAAPAIAAWLGDRWRGRRAVLVLLAVSAALCVWQWLWLMP